MKVTITKFERKYQFNCDSVAQICGQNIQEKEYVFESLRRYFGGYKYSEEIDPWRENVLIDGNQVGRKFYQIISVSNREQLISCIGLTKQSIVLKYIQYILQEFSFQKEFELISEQLDIAFINLNQKISELGPIELTYKETQIWDIIQKSELYGCDGRDLQSLTNFELITTLINTIKKKNALEPENYLLLFQNLDHLVSTSEYREIYYDLKCLQHDCNIFSIISISLDGYVVFNQDGVEDICVFGEEVFTFPDYDNLKNSLISAFPIQRDFTDEKLLEILEKIVQHIGLKNYLLSLEDNVICKIINTSLGLKESLKTQQNQCIYAFLKA